MENLFTFNDNFILKSKKILPLGSLHNDLREKLEVSLAEGE